MPEWLQRRVTQCNLTFVDGALGEGRAVVAGEAGDSVSKDWLGDRRKMQVELVAVAAPAPAPLQSHQQQLPRQQQVQHTPSLCGNIRWQNIVDPASCPPIIPATAHSAAPVQASACAAVLHVHHVAAARPREVLLPACTDASAAAVDLMAAVPAAAASKKSPKKRKHRRQTPPPALFASPPKMYKDDPGYREYYERTKKTNAFVRQIVLERPA